MRRIGWSAWLVAVLMILAWGPVYAQARGESSPGDSSRIGHFSGQDRWTQRTPVTKEFDLGVIRIEAIIEKPNVDIIPKRMQPKEEEAAFLRRSFAKEIREVPDELLLPDDELDAAKKLQGMREILAKRSKELKGDEHR